MTHSESAADMVLDVLQRRKWVGLITAAVALSLAAPLPLFLPDIYRATATVLVEHRDVPTNFVRPSVAELETRLVTIRQEILSRARLLQVLDRFDLYPEMRERATPDGLIDRMRRDIHVDMTSTDPARSRPATIGISVSFVGLEPETTAAVANALATMYVEENTAMRTRQAGRTADFLKGELDAAAQNLQVQQARLDAYRSQHGSQLPQQTATNIAMLERLNLQLQLNSEQQLWAKQRRDRLAEDVAKAETVADPELETLRNRLAEVQTRFTERHPEIIYLQQRIAELEAQGPPPPSPDNPAAARLRASLNEVEAELATLAGEERGLRASIGAFDRRLEAAPRREQELDALQKDYATAKALHDSLLQRYEEAQLAQSFERTETGESFRILDPALPPAMPAAPNRTRLLIMVLLLAVGAGAGALVVAEQLDTSFHTVEDVSRFTTVPILATIPFIRTPSHAATAGVRFALATSAVMFGCVMLAWVSSYVAREDAQLVWILARGQL